MQAGLRRGLLTAVLVIASAGSVLGPVPTAAAEPGSAACVAAQSRAAVAGQHVARTQKKQKKAKAALHKARKADHQDRATRLATKVKKLKKATKAAQGELALARQNVAAACAVVPPTPPPTPPPTTETTVSSVAPRVGTAAGGELVTLAGTNLAGVAAVWFGEYRSADVVQRTATSIQVRTPLAYPGTFPVTVEAAAPGPRIATGRSFTFDVPETAPDFDAEPASGVSSIPADAVSLVEVDDTLAPPDPAGVPEGFEVEATGYRLTVSTEYAGGLEPGDLVYVEPGGADLAGGLTGEVVDVTPDPDADVVLVRVTPVASDQVLSSFSTASSGALPDDPSTGPPAMALTYRRGGPTTLTSGGRTVAVADSAGGMSGGKGLFSCKDRDGNPNQDLVASLTIGLRFENTRYVFDLVSPGPFRDPYLNVGLWTEPVLSVSASVEGQVTCGLSDAAKDAAFPAIPVPGTPLTVDIGPYLDVTVSAGGSISYEQRLYRGFSYVKSGYGVGRATRSGSADDPEFTGGMSASVKVRGGGFFELGAFDRVGVKAELGPYAEGTLRFSPPATVSCTIEIGVEASAALFLDVWVTRWEYTFARLTFVIRTWDLCTFDSGDPDGPPVISTTSLAEAPVGEAYREQLTTADDRAGRWSLASGALPPGLALSNGGRIAGTPSGTPGLFTFTVRFTDSAGRTATADLAITTTGPSDSCTTQTSIPVGECRALMAIKRANPTSGLDDWGTGDPCHWGWNPPYRGRLTCSDGHVATLELDFFVAGTYGLGTLPPEIADLTRLEELFLRGNGFNGAAEQLDELPVELGELTRLRRLTVIYTDITQVPAEIGNLSRLESLTLSGNRLTSVPPEIGDLGALINLDLRDQNLAQLPPEIGDLTALESMSLGGHLLTAVPSEIGNLAHLRILEVDASPSTRMPAELWTVDSLERLILGESGLTTLPAEIENLTNLTDLGLSGSTLRTLPPELGELTQLESLQLGSFRGSSATPTAVTTLPRQIGNLTNLIRLELYDNRLTSLPTELGDLPRLRDLDVGRNQLTSVPASVGSLSRLTELNLDQNRLTSVPAEIGALAWLEELRLADNELTGDVSPWAQPLSEASDLDSLGAVLTLRGNGCLDAGGDTELEDWLTDLDPAWRDGCP